MKTITIAKGTKLLEVPNPVKPSTHLVYELGASIDVVVTEDTTGTHIKYRAENGVEVKASAYGEKQGVEDFKGILVNLYRENKGRTEDEYTAPVKRMLEALEPIVKVEEIAAPEIFR